MATIIYISTDTCRGTSRSAHQLIIVPAVFFDVIAGGHGIVVIIVLLYCQPTVCTSARIGCETATPGSLSMRPCSSPAGSRV